MTTVNLNINSEGTDLRSVLDLGNGNHASWVSLSSSISNLKNAANLVSKAYGTYSSTTSPATLVGGTGVYQGSTSLSLSVSTGISTPYEFPSHTTSSAYGSFIGWSSSISTIAAAPRTIGNTFSYSYVGGISSSFICYGYFSKTFQIASGVLMSQCASSWTTTVWHPYISQYDGTVYTGSRTVSLSMMRKTSTANIGYVCMKGEPLSGNPYGPINNSNGYILSRRFVLSFSRNYYTSVQSSKTGHLFSQI